MDGYSPDLHVNTIVESLRYVTFLVTLFERTLDLFEQCLPSKFLQPRGGI